MGVLDGRRIKTLFLALQNILKLKNYTSADLRSVVFSNEKSRKSVGVEAKINKAECMTEPQDSKKKAKLEAAKLVNIPCNFMILFGSRGTVT